MQTIFLLAVFFTQHSWASSDDEDYAFASGDGGQAWSESKASGMHPPTDNKGLCMYRVYCYVYHRKDRKVNILILSDISFFCTYTLVATKRAHWRPWQIQQVCKESKDNLTCKQLYIMSVKLNKFSRRRIQRYCAGPRKS